MVPVGVSHSCRARNEPHLHQGLKDSKDYCRDAKEAMKTENERWEIEGKTIEVGTKDKAHKAEVGLAVVTVFPVLSAAPETCQALCAQYPT